MIRVFGAKDFSVDKYHKEIVSEQSHEQLTQFLEQLTTSCENVQAEIGDYLYENYKCFL